MDRPRTRLPLRVLLFSGALEFEVQRLGRGELGIRLTSDRLGALQTDIFHNTFFPSLWAVCAKLESLQRDALLTHLYENNGWRLLPPEAKILHTNRLSFDGVSNYCYVAETYHVDSVYTGLLEGVPARAVGGALRSRNQFWDFHNCPMGRQLQDPFRPSWDVFEKLAEQITPSLEILDKRDTKLMATPTRQLSQMHTEEVLRSFEKTNLSGWPVFSFYGHLRQEDIHAIPQIVLEDFLYYPLGHKYKTSPNPERNDYAWFCLRFFETGTDLDHRYASYEQALKAVGDYLLSKGLVNACSNTGAAAAVCQ